MRVKGSTVKHFQQRKVEHEKKNFLKKMEGKSQKAERIFFRKDVTKKRK